MKPALLFLTLLLAACVQTSGTSRPTQPATWYLYPKGLDVGGPMLEDDFCIVVTDRALPRALQRLESVPSAAISAREVAAFTGRWRRTPAGTRPYLVRALRFTDRPQGFSAYLLKDGSVSTTCASMGCGPAPMENYAQVVFLRSPPTQVYPGFSLTV